MPNHLKRLSVILFVLIASLANAQIDVFSNGSSSDFHPTQNTVIDLGLASTGTWNQGNVGPNGVYDPTKWVVVFHYTSVTIPAGVTVTFKNHPKNPPVVWLVSGNVQIDGVVDLSGQDTQTLLGALATPGPGGFRGGSAPVSVELREGAGFGPGGGNAARYSGSYGTVGGSAFGAGSTYGNARVMPLIGGSGGGGAASNSYSGGAGGGAILIACNNTIALNGRVTANGGGHSHGHNYGDDVGGGGSGGGIRLISSTFSGASTGILAAVGGANSYDNGGADFGGSGRIRVEAVTSLYQGVITPNPSLGAPDSVVALFPNLGSPLLQVLSVGGVAVPADPSSDFGAPDLALPTTAGVEVIVKATNVPLNWTVQVRQGMKNGPANWVTCTFVSGDATLSTWHATMTFPAGPYAVIARGSCHDFN